MQDQSNAAKQRRAAAFHEAGHAVVAGHWGYDVYQNHVGQDGLGEVRFTHPPTEYDSPEGRFRLLTVDVAGSLAEEMAGFIPSAWEGLLEGHNLARAGLDAGQTPSEILDEYERGDAAEAGILLRELDATEAERELRGAHDAARTILSERWDDVEAMVQAGGR